MKLLRRFALFSLICLALTGRVAARQNGDTLVYLWPDTLRGKQLNILSLAAKDDRFFAATEYLGLWMYVESNKTWVQQGWRQGLFGALSFAVPTLWSVAVIDSGYLLASTSYFGTYKSRDNGAHWRLVIDAQKTQSPKYNIPFEAACFLVSRSGVVFAGGHGILRSTDNGESWSWAASDSLTYPFVWRMVETPSGVLLAATSSQVVGSPGILRSIDNGKTWTVSTNGLSDRAIQDLSAHPAQGSEMVCAITWTGKVFQSDDAGLSWHRLTELGGPRGGAIFASANLGVFAGFSFGFYDTRLDPLYRYSESRWQRVNGLLGSSVLSLAQFRSNKLLIGTDDGVWVATFQNVTPVEKESTVPTAYELFQNYPNPFNPATTIKFSLPERSIVKLTVHNLIGEKIETLVNDVVGAGTHEVRWNAARFPSGVYLYRLEGSPTNGGRAGGFQQTKKAILVK